MSYTRGTIENFIESIPEAVMQEEFRERLMGVQFHTTDNGIDTASSADLDAAFVGSPVRHLLDVLGRDYVRHIPEEDWKKLEAAA